MPLRLVVDACSMLHAKHLPPPGARLPGGIELIDRLIEAGVRLFTTTRVYGEQTAMSLSGTLTRWEMEQVIEHRNASAAQARQVRNGLRRKDPEPGRHDIALIALAEDIDGVLLTHDYAASALAHRRGVLVVDLLDLGDLLLQRGALPAGTLDQVFAPWNTSEWRPDDWAGSALATLESRPRRMRVQEVLTAALAPPVQDP